MHLLAMEHMGLLRKHYDPASRDFLWELTDKGRAEREKLRKEESEKSAKGFEQSPH